MIETLLVQGANETHQPSLDELLVDGYDAAAEAPDSSGAEAPESSLAAAPPFMVGDIVVLDDSVDKRFQRQEVQVIRITQKMLVVTMLSGKERACKTLYNNGCNIVQPSTLRSATSSVASLVGALVVTVVAAAVAPELNEEEYAKSLFGDAD
jgi:hypothetical protein